MIAFLTIIWNRFLQLLETPKHSPEMLWFLIPLIVTLLVMEFYFGRYKQEKLGWNSAIENNLVLLFVSLDLLRHLFSGAEIIQFKLRLAMAIIVGVVAIFLMLLEFFHAVSEKFASMVSSHFVINLTSIFVVIMVYSKAPIDIPTIVVVLALMVTIMFFAEYVHYIIPKFIDVEKLKLERLEKRLANVKGPLKSDQYGVIKDVDVVSVGKKKAVVAVPADWTGGEVNVILTKEPSLGRKK